MPQSESSLRCDNISLLTHTSLCLGGTGTFETVISDDTDLQDGHRAKVLDWHKSTFDNRSTPTCEFTLRMFVHVEKKTKGKDEIEWIPTKTSTS